MILIKFLFILFLAGYTQAQEAHSFLPQPPLKNLAQIHKRLFGSAVDSNFLDKDKIYAAIVKREFSVIVPIDEMKFASIQSSKLLLDF